MRKYFRHFRRMEDWYRVGMWVERGYLKPPEGYDLLKLFPYKHKPEDIPYYRKKVKIDETDPIIILKKHFLKKYPEHIDTYLGINYSNHALIDSFVQKQYNLMKQGHSEYKAFEIVESELSSNLQAERRDRAILEDVALSNRTRSLMDVFEQREEYIQRQKVTRLERDLPEFLRAEHNRSLLDYENKNRTPKIHSYEPATYILSNKQDLDTDDDNKKKNFLTRSESILNYYHSIGEINDGLNVLHDQEINRQAHETNQRFKGHMRSLLKKLEKFNVKLNDEGFVDYSSINDVKAIPFVKKQEQFCNIALLSKDLDFEIPHQARMKEIKYEILEEIKQEQERLLEIYTGRQRKELVLPEERLETYEDFFKLDKKCKYFNI